MVSVKTFSFTLKQTLQALLCLINVWGVFNRPINICFFNSTSWFLALTAALQLRFLYRLCLICLLNFILQAWCHACLLAYVVIDTSESGCKALSRPSDNIVHSRYPDVYHYKAAENKDFMFWNSISTSWADCYRKLLKQAYKQLTMRRPGSCWFSRRQQFVYDSFLILQTRILSLLSHFSPCLVMLQHNANILHLSYHTE